MRLGFLSPLSNWLIPELLGEYRRRFPQVSFALRQDGAARILAALIEGALDVLITIPGEDHPAVSWEPLFDEDIVLVVPAVHRLAGADAVSLADVADETYLMLAAGYGLRAVTEDMCQAAGFRPRIGFGVAWCPGHYRSAAADAFRSFIVAHAGRVAARRPG